MRIYKYEAPVEEHFSILMHIGKIIHSRVTASEVTIWAEVDEVRGQRHRHFQIVGTGFEPPENGKHLSTSVASRWVWHLYDVTGDAE